MVFNGFISTYLYTQPSKVEMFELVSAHFTAKRHLHKQQWVRFVTSTVRWTEKCLPKPVHKCKNEGTGGERAVPNRVSASLNPQTARIFAVAQGLWAAQR